MITKHLKVSNIFFYAFISIFPLLHLLYFHELVQNIARTPGKIVIVSGIFFLIFTVYFINSIKKYTITISTIIFFMFISYLLVYEVFYYNTYLLINIKTSQDFFISHMTTIYGIQYYFLLGFFYKGFTQHRKKIYYIYIILSLNALMYIDPTTYVLTQKNTNLELYGIYLFLGDSYAIIAIITFLLLKDSSLQSIIFLTSLIILFVLNSRTSLYFFTATILFYLIIVNKKNLFNYILLLLLTVLLFYTLYPELFFNILDSRMLSFLFDHSDRSIDARNEFMEVGINGIRNYWFEGDYGGEVLYFGRLGVHIHNYLAIFRQYGIVAFLLFCILALFLIKNIYIWIKNHKKYSTDYEIFILLTFFLLLEISLARGMNFQQVFFVVGISASLGRKNHWIYKEKTNESTI